MKEDDRMKKSQKGRVVRYNRWGYIFLIPFVDETVLMNEKYIEDIFSLEQSL